MFWQTNYKILTTVVSLLGVLLVAVRQSKVRTVRERFGSYQAGKLRFDNASGRAAWIQLYYVLKAVEGVKPRADSRKGLITPILRSYCKHCSESSRERRRRIFD